MSASASRATRYVQVDLVRSLIDDLPAEIWDIRLDVALPMFLLFWAMVLGRGVPPLIHTSFEEARARRAAPGPAAAHTRLSPFPQVQQLAIENDYFCLCPKLVLALLFVKPDGGFGIDPKWPMCLAGALVLMLAGSAS